MNPIAISPEFEAQSVTPACPVFGECGGCAYQNLPYETELQVKGRNLRQLLQGKLGISENLFDPIVDSPKSYNYRHRLDLTLRRSKGEVLFGFQSPNTHRMVSIEACPIAMEKISDFIPTLREEALAKFPADYRTANLVVRTGDDGRVLWGGIGRRSLQLKEEDYLWTEIEGRRIFYSLDTFFQANLSILPRLIQKLRALAALDKDTLFLDLYSGVGLFGLCLAPEAGKVIMIEDCPPSVELARYNAAYHRFPHLEIHQGRVEDVLSTLDLRGQVQGPVARVVAMIDPPRQGLSPQMAEWLAGTRFLNSLFYLSCHPESLARDLEVFLKKGWRVEKIVPFDFFPRTQHLETLVHLKL